MQELWEVQSFFSLCVFSRKRSSWDCGYSLLWRKALRWWEENITLVIRFTFMMHGCKNELTCLGWVCKRSGFKECWHSSHHPALKGHLQLWSKFISILWNKNDLTLATKQVCSWRLWWKKNINKCLKLDALKCFLSSSHIRVQQVRTDKGTVLLLIQLQHSASVFHASRHRKLTEERWES